MDHKRRRSKAATSQIPKCSKCNEEMVVVRHKFGDRHTSLCYCIICCTSMKFPREKCAQVMHDEPVQQENSKPVALTSVMYKYRCFQCEKQWISLIINQQEKGVKSNKFQKCNACKSRVFPIAMVEEASEPNEIAMQKEETSKPQPPKIQSVLSSKKNKSDIYIIGDYRCYACHRVWTSLSSYQSGKSVANSYLNCNRCKCRNLPFNVRSSSAPKTIAPRVENATKIVTEKTVKEGVTTTVNKCNRTINQKINDSADDDLQNILYKIFL